MRKKIRGTSIPNRYVGHWSVQELGKAGVRGGRKEGGEKEGWGKHALQSSRKKFFFDVLELTPPPSPAMDRCNGADPQAEHAAARASSRRGTESA